MESVSFNPATGNFDEGVTPNIQNSQPLYRSPMYENTGKRYEITPGNGEGLKVTSKHSSLDVGDLRCASEGVLSTATNNSFAVRHASDVKDSTLVTVGGMQMTARSAAEAGLLVRNPDGSYGEVSGKKPEGDIEGEAATDVSPDQHDPDPYNGDLSNPELETALESAAQDLGGYEGLDRMALSAISGMTKGDVSHAVKTLAGAAGVEAQEAETFINGLYDGFRSQSAKYINQKHGIDGDEIFDWAARALSPAEKSSLFYRVYLGRSRCLDDLVSKYQKFGKR